MEKHFISKEFPKFTVYSPTIDIFINRIKNKRYFNFVKNNHLMWDIIWRNGTSHLPPPTSHLSSWLKELTRSIASSKDAIYWGMTYDLLFETLSCWLHPKQNYYYGYGIREKMWHVEHSTIEFFAKNRVPLFGYIWHEYAKNEFEKFFSELVDYNFVYIGPKEWGEMALKYLPNNKITTIYIHPRLASKNIEETAILLNYHYKPNIIYLCSAGWLSPCLFQAIKHKDIFALDIGTGFMHWFEKIFNKKCDQTDFWHWEQLEGFK